MIYIRCLASVHAYAKVAPPTIPAADVFPWQRQRAIQSRAGEWRILFKRAFRVTDQLEELEESVDQSAAGVVIDSGDSAR